MDSAYATELARIWNLVGGSTCPPMSAIPEFKPPKLRLSSLGEVVWLSKKDQEIKNKGNKEENEGLKVIACYLGRNDLEKHAWANVLAHDMNLYVKFTTLIGNGNFNGRNDWTTVTNEGHCVIN
ncbi:hypothetical protein CABS03_02461 [Colletotrichum abscissum]|uniref:Uncharacterized protein n=2 Tax=Colletotrichum abscissum TaxID=1671311 RepID=A0A9Q0B970_9PEZI|nr:hypothetical protein CABS02_01526 [Colletotrichum abscissum]